MKWIKSLIIIMMMFGLVAGIANSKAVLLYMSGVKEKAVWYADIQQEEIQSYANKHNQPPIEPRVDKIWKLIPGYNGLIIDVEATLKQMEQGKSKNKEEISYIWKEVEPKQTLSQFGAYPIYRGNPEKPMVSFLVNVAWGTEYVAPILEILAKENVHVTFFLDGSWLKKNPDLAIQMVKKGHELGNHGYSHALMSRVTSQRVSDEISKTEELIKSITGNSSTYFAPPAGDFDQKTLDIAKSNNLLTVLWTLDTVDWKKPSPEVIIERIIPKVGNGHLILMHPTKSTVEALPTLIREIKKKGLKIAPVKETLSTKRIPPVESPFNL